MGLFNFLKNKQKTINDEKINVSGGKLAIEWVKRTNTIPLVYNQYLNFYMYKGDLDYLGWYLTKGVYDLGLQVIMTQQVRINYNDYFWRGSYLETGIKRTHSGMPKLIVDTLVNCLGVYQVKDNKEEEISNVATDRLNEILKENNFKATFKKQNTMDLVIGDGAYIINVEKGADYPYIEYIDGRDCTFEYKGDRITAVIINKNYEYNNKLYECYEKRSTRRVYDEELGKYKTIATIEYRLFVQTGNKSWSEVKINSIPQTENLKNLEYPNLPFMLAVPCVRKMNAETKRGESIYTGCSELFDDLDQALSIESNTYRASVPVEYIDSNLIEKDGKGRPIMPSVYGKQFITYKGAKNYNETPKEVHTQFYNIDWTKLTNEAHELIIRICAICGVAPASIGYETSRKDNAEAQREKEKATLQTLKDMQSYEVDILTNLFTKVMAVDDYMVNPDEEPQQSNIQVMFSDYGTPTRSERIDKFMDAYLKGGMSLDRYIQEVYFDEDKATQEKEKQALLEAKNTDKIGFNFMNEE